MSNSESSPEPGLIHRYPCTDMYSTKWAADGSDAGIETNKADPLEIGGLKTGNQIRDQHGEPNTEDKSGTRRISNF